VPGPAHSKPSLHWAYHHPGPGISLNFAAGISFIIADDTILQLGGYTMNAKQIIAFALAALLLAAGALAYASTTSPEAATGNKAEAMTDVEEILPIGAQDVTWRPTAKLAAEVKILKAMDDLGLSREQVESLAGLARKLDEQVTEGIDRITEQLEKEKKELLAGPAGDAVHEAEDLIAEQKAAISKALTAAQKEAMGILSPSQRSKALEMIRKIEIPEAARKRAMFLGPRMLKALSDLLDQKLGSM